MEQGVDIPDLIDTKNLWTLNWNNTFNYAVNLNNQVRISLPFLFQSEEFLFETVEDGQPYTPPEGMEMFFHQDRMVMGFGDMSIAGQHFIFQENWVIGTELGVNIPTGLVNVDDYSFTEYRQSIGSGVFTPTAQVMLFSRETQRGFMGFLNASTPFYANSDAYRTGHRVGGDMGYWLRWKKDYLTLLKINVSHQTGDTWHNQPISQSHRSTVGIGLTQTGRLSDKQEWMIGLQQPLWIQIWEEDVKSQNKITIFSLGLTWL